MSDIKFQCLHCKQSFEAPQDMVGIEVDCPACQQKIVVPTTQKQVVYSSQHTPQIKMPKESSSQKRGSKFHLLGMSTVGLVLLSFLLPWISVSCNNQKFISTTGFTILANTFQKQTSSMTPEVSSSVQQYWLCAGLISLLFLSCFIFALALLATTRRSRAVVSYGATCAVLAILVCLAIGYVYGVRAEGTIKAEQVRSLRNAHGLEALGATIGASLNLSVDMDAGYYLSLAGFLIALGAFLIPYHLNDTRTTRNVVVAATTGGITGLCTIVCLGACLITLAKPAQFTKPEDFKSSLTDKQSDSKSQTPTTAKSLILSPDAPPASIPQRTEEVFKAQLPETFLNFHLGCTVEEAKKVMETGSAPVSFVNADGIQEEEYTLVYRGNQSLPDATGTLLGFWKGKLYMVYVRFNSDSDKCERLFTVLKHKVTEKYGDEKGIIAFNNYKAEWCVKGLTVQLIRELGIMEGAVILVGFHNWLSSEVDKAKLKKDADQMGDL